jgi:hypothetical protein
VSAPLDPSGVLSGGDVGAVVAVGLLAEPDGGGAEPVADRLRDVSGLCFQGGRAVAEPGGLLVGAGCLGSTRVHLGRVAD